MLDRLTGPPCTCGHEAERHLKSEYYNLGQICVIPGCGCIRYMPTCERCGYGLDVSDYNGTYLCDWHGEDVATKARELTEERR